jgi:hypothetical protein
MSWLIVDFGGDIVAVKKSYYVAFLQNIRHPTVFAPQLGYVRQEAAKCHWDLAGF